MLKANVEHAGQQWIGNVEDMIVSKPTQCLVNHLPVRLNCVRSTAISKANVGLYRRAAGVGRLGGISAIGRPHRSGIHAGSTAENKRRAVP
jgi:hypothetical protein